MKLIDLFNINEGGIIKELGEAEEFDFLSQDNISTLDIDFYYNCSGDKTISPLYERLLIDEKNGKISNALRTISQLLINRFSDKWNRLYSLFTNDYNPLSDVKYSEIETPNITKTSLEKENTSITTSKTNGERTEVSAFNVSTYSPSEEKSITSSETINGNSDNNFKDLKEEEKGTRTKEIEGTNKKTYQELFNEELELRKKSFYQIMFEDIDSVMCLQIYL